MAGGEEPVGRNPTTTTTTTSTRTTTVNSTLTPTALLLLALALPSFAQDRPKEEDLFGPPSQEAKAEGQPAAKIA